MTPLLLVAAWLVSSVLAYRMLVLYWTADLDYTTEDRPLLAAVSLIPIAALPVALVLWLTTIDRPRRVIKRRRSS